MRGANITLTAIWVYPIKSCRGIALQEAQVGPRGIARDRGWMIVNREGVFITQRLAPRLALIEPGMHGGQLRLSAPGMPPAAVPLDASGAAVEVTVWRDRCVALDQGAEAAAWLSHFLAMECRLVRLADDWVRPVDPVYAEATDQVGFADGYPFLLTSESSLADLNGRLPAPVPMNRFRPNLVIAGAEPYAEDRWRRIRIGELSFRVAKACARCVTTTVDQLRGVADGPEPLATLARYRKQERGAMFGQNLLHDGHGRLRVGDEIEVLEAVSQSGIESVEPSARSRGAEH